MTDPVPADAALRTLGAIWSAVEDELAEPWDEGSEWFARRVRALILGEPPPPHPASHPTEPEPT